jgi:hypothetical protein
MSLDVPIASAIKLCPVEVMFSERIPAYHFEEEISLTFPLINSRGSGNFSISHQDPYST